MRKWFPILLICLALLMIGGGASYAADGDLIRDINGVYYVEWSGQYWVYEYSGSAYEVRIPAIINGKTVVGIDYDAFYGLQTLQSVILPATVKYIDNGAFMNCQNLTTISMPGVVYLGQEVFFECYSLTNVTLPSSLTSIGSAAFQGCSNLKSISLPNGITNIPDWLFYECYSLASVTLPNTVRTMGQGVFQSCYSLTSVTIPQGVNSIPAWTFFDCMNLTNLSLPSTVTSIGYEAFRGCNDLASISLPSALTLIEANAFAQCANLRNVTIPTNVSSIGSYAFWSCERLNSIIIPSSVESINDGAFASCPSLQSVSIQNGITYIGSYVFEGCTNLTSIFIPTTVTSIGYGSFDPALHTFIGYRDSYAEYYAWLYDIPFTPIETLNFQVLWEGGPGAMSMPSPTSITGGQTLSKPTAPLRGYQTFAGWYMDSTLTTAYDFSQPVTSNLTLYAKWVPGTYLYFWVDGNTSLIPRQHILYMQRSQKPVDPVKPGYRFAGWYEDLAFTKPYTFNTLLPFMKVIYAKWDIMTYTVDWIGGPGANDMPAPQVVKGSTILEKPPVPTRGYQTFAGWYTDSGLTKAYDFSQPVTSNLTLYAKWVPGTYLYFWVDGSTSSVPRQYIKFMEYSQMPIAPTKAGYTFGGWYEDAAYTKPYAFNTLLPYIKVVYAKWNPSGAYSVDWIGGPGANQMPPAQLIAQGTLLKAPAIPTRGYQTFAGWYTDKALTQKYDFTQPVTSNLVLYAKWVPGTYLYFWVEGSTSTVPRQYIKYMEYTQVPIDPVLEGHTFAGWYTDKTYTTEFTFGRLMPYLTIAYAKFEPVATIQEAPAQEVEASSDAIIPLEETTEPETIEPETIEPSLRPEPETTEPLDEDSVLDVTIPETSTH